MKIREAQEGLRIGDLIANFYRAYGKRRAKGYLRLAFETHLVVFREYNRSALAKGKATA